MQGLGTLVRRAPDLRSRAAWIIADQAASSLANAALTVAIARAVSPTEYGAFALAFSVYSLVVALSQSAGAQVFVVGYSGAEDSAQRRAAAATLGTVLVLGAGCALVVATVGALLGQPLRDVLLALGVLLPGLLLQDTLRTLFVARGTPARAFVNNLVWIGTQAALIGGLLLAEVTTVAPYVVAWAAAAGLAAVVGLRQGRLTPAPRASLRFLRGHREVSLPSLANSAAILGSLQLAFVLISVVGSVEDVGALRAVQTLLGPLNIIGFAASSFAVPEIVRREPGRRGLVVAAVVISGGLVLVGLAWGGVLLLMPDQVGSALLGETWDHAQAALPGMIAYTCLIGATSGATAVMRAVNRASYAFWTSAALGPLVLVLAAAGAHLGGAEGASLGFALAGLLVVPLCWTLLARAARLGRRPVRELV